MSLVGKVDISPGYRTDHSLIELELKISDFIKGRGFWKFNNQLLKNKEYILKMKDIISDVRQKICGSSIQ